MKKFELRKEVYKFVRGSRESGSGNLDYKNVLYLEGCCSDCLGNPFDISLEYSIVYVRVSIFKNEKCLETYNIRNYLETKRLVSAILSIIDVLEFQHGVV